MRRTTLKELGLSLVGTGNFLRLVILLYYGKKSKNVVRLNGVRRNEIMQTLCGLMMCPFDPSTLDARQSSMQSTGVYETLEGLQQGQNSETIQTELYYLCDIVISDFYGQTW